jgi:AraC-like DNA-binding protein
MVDPAAIELETQRRGNHTGLNHAFARWPVVRADLIRRTGLGRQETNIVARDHSLLLNIRGTASRGENYLDGRPVKFRARPSGDLCFLPAGHSWTGWDEGDDTAAYLFIAMDREFVRGLFAKMPGPLHIERLVPELGFQDTEIQLAARRIKTELENQDLASALAVESYATTIVTQLWRRSGGKSVHAKAGLPPSVVTRVLERIEATLEQSITVAELAAEAGFSVHHFCRAFGQSTGWPPHTYIIRKRVERACELLRTSNMSITEIAMACGYSSGSHLSASFRKEIGTSPTLYRNSWRH